MTNSEIFHDETTPYGGRFQREHAPEAVRRSYDSVEKRANDLIRSARAVVPNVPEIHLDFILNGKINALAFRSHDRYFIGIYTGTLFMLRSVIGRMLSDARLFRFAGDAKSERDDLGPLTGYVPDAEVMYKKEALSTPRDRARRDYAAFLQDQALLFLIGHELTHILHGHIDYLRTKRGEKVTVELEWLGDTDEEGRLERQCMEVDADRRSIASRIDSMRVGLKSGMEQIVSWRPKQEDPGLMIFDWAVSIHILFRLFGDLRFSQVDPAKSAYPSLALRHAICEAAAVQAIDLTWDPLLQSSAVRGLVLARLETELSFARTLGEEFDAADMVRQRMANLNREHGDKIAMYWNQTLADRLEPFSYERLASPDSSHVFSGS
jgi:hypothetical protein